MNRRPKTNPPIISARKLRIGSSKENENPDMVTNPYLAIVMARDSLRHKEENTKMQAEIQKLDEEMNELKRKTETEKVAIQELELVLTKRKRRVEKCRRLAEAQSSYRAMLEKMIRDAMHQSVIYKEQVRLNQAAANALKARLEAQKAICDSSEKDLYRKFKQRDELENQIRPEGNHHLRKRSRVDDLALDGNEDRVVLLLPTNQTSVHSERGSNSRARSHKELRVYFEEEQRAYEERLSQIQEGTREGFEEEKGEKIETLSQIQEGTREGFEEEKGENIGALITMGKNDKLYDVRLPVFGAEIEEEKEDEESRRKRGKGNVEKWLQMLLEDTPENIDDYEESKADGIIEKLNVTYPKKENDVLGHGESVQTEEKTEDLNFERKEKVKMKIRRSPYTIPDKGKRKELGENADVIVEELDINYRKNELEVLGQGKIPETEVKTGESKDEEKIPMRNPPYTIIDKRKGNELSRNESKGIGRRNSFEGGKIKEKNEKEKGLVRSESFSLLRRIPSSPSLILGMKKGVDYCIRRKPSVIGDDDLGDKDDAATKNNSFFKTFKKSVKI